MTFALEFRSPHTLGLYETQALRGLANFCVKIFGLILVVLQVRLASILDFALNLAKRESHVLPVLVLATV